MNPSPGAGHRLPFRIVDAFAPAPFSGNPAGVVLPTPEGPRLEELPTPLLQAVAAELNLSETAFPHPPDAQGVRRLRWFTPTTEVTLCGHATLAAAHALVEAGAELPLHFASLSGPLAAEAEGPGRLRLDFPADPPREEAPPEGLLEALGIPAGTPTRFATGARCALLALEAEDRGVLGALAPDMRALGQVRLARGVMGVSVTAPRDAEGGRPAFESRFFGPWVGVDEDPVTGMAHCLLGPWWHRETGASEFRAFQGGVRKGELGVRVLGDRVHLVGSAVTVAAGELHLPPG